MGTKQNTEKKNEKRKRTTNTTREQYEIYLSAMESDYALRSGTINPTLGENYLSKKWEELSNKLNAIGNGPKLTSDEWKKRFTDWKYATKNKYRKISEHRMRTGSGPQLNITMNELGERALSAWGKVTVTGNQEITNYEGIEIAALENSITKNSCDESNKMITFNSTTDVIFEFENDINNTPEAENKSAIASVKNHVSEKSGSSTNQEVYNNETCTSHEENSRTNRTKKYSPSRAKPLSVLTEKLIEINKDSTNTLAEFNSILNKFSENYIKIKQGEIELEKIQLRLEVEKIKINYPEFKFDI